ncbi:hypothetical protein [Kitasatospora sp. NPDC058218]|uniref:hypothetical protein n=1 Tax=Kitasatospora sp. NPDC058218 TaxID=3346385 RepID=UPI0036DF0D27
MNTSDNIPDQDRPEPRKPVWPRNLALALAAAAVAFGAMKAVEPPSEDAGGGTPPAAAPAVPPAAPSPTAPSAGAQSATTPPAAAESRPAVPLEQAFPAEVRADSGTVYTKVAAKTLDSCTFQDSVGPRLISMIKRSKGCVSHQVALYKDARNNQFNLSVFTMREPADTVHLVTQLAMAFDDYQVGAQAPPPGSGLPTLAPDSGMIQAFTGTGRAMVVGLGQWSDGRQSDYQELTDRLDPLLKGVTANVSAHETRS